MFSFTDSTAPRITRELFTATMRAMASTPFVVEGPMTLTIAIASRIAGNDWMASTTRWMTRSIQPPAKPENSPMTAPASVPNPTVRNPTYSEIRAPYMMRVRMSRPMPSDPSQ